MEDQVQKLNTRYGSRHNYQALSEQQRVFLLKTEISDHRDVCGGRTVSVNSIGESFLDLTDCFSYISHRNSPGSAFQYSRIRIPDFKKALSVSEDPKDVGGEKYVFELPDNVRVEVSFRTAKDTV